MGHHARNITYWSVSILVSFRLKGKCVLHEVESHGEELEEDYEEPYPAEEEEEVIEQYGYHVRFLLVMLLNMNPMTARKRITIMRPRAKERLPAS